MGFIYIIQNNINKMLYIGQTIRNIEIRWKEHRVKAKNRLLNNAIKEYRTENFSFFKIYEIDNDKLDVEESKMIKKYDTLYPKGYNLDININFTKESNILGGKSEIGHDKHSLKMKEKYKEIDCLKDLGDIPRGISYWKGNKKGYHYHGFKVRKVGIKSKEFISSINKNSIKNDLERAKNYLKTEQRESVSEA
jgi:hypothetical protein